LSSFRVVDVDEVAFLEEETIIVFFAAEDGVEGGVVMVSTKTSSPTVVIVVVVLLLLWLLLLLAAAAVRVRLRVDAGPEEGVINEGAVAGEKTSPSTKSVTLKVLPCLFTAVKVVRPPEIVKVEVLFDDFGEGVCMAVVERDVLGVEVEEEVFLEVDEEGATLLGDSSIISEAWCEAEVDAEWWLSDSSASSSCFFGALARVNGNPRERRLGRLAARLLERVVEAEAPPLACALPLLLLLVLLLALSPPPADAELLRRRVGMPGPNEAAPEEELLVILLLLLLLFVVLFIDRRLRLYVQYTAAVTTRSLSAGLKSIYLVYLYIYYVRIDTETGLLRRNTDTLTRVKGAVRQKRYSGHWNVTDATRFVWPLDLRSFAAWGEAGCVLGFVWEEDRLRRTSKRFLLIGMIIIIWSY
jgi:hypothetical protein